MKQEEKKSDGLTPDRAGSAFSWGDFFKKISSFFLQKRVVFALSLTAIFLFALVSVLLNYDKFVQNPANENSEMKYVDENIEKYNGQFTLVRSSFSSSADIVGSSVTPSVPYSKIGISEIANLKDFEANEGVILTDAQKKALEEDGFFLTENGYITKQEDYGDTDDFTDSYSEFSGGPEYMRQQSDAIFVSSDAALHLYHILVDRSFQSIEEKKFQPMLREMTKVLFLDSIEKYNSTSDEKLKESYKRLSAYYLVPLVILDTGSRSAGVDVNPDDFETFATYLDAVNEQTIKESSDDLVFSLDNQEYYVHIDNEIFDLAKQEIDLISKAEELAPSPIFTPLREELVNDYTQFKPRSHYTKNDVLKSYFVAMMWYGRMGFTLNSEDLTRDALIVTTQINTLKVGKENLSSLWSNMASVIDFFVGEADDLTAYEYTDVMRGVYNRDKLSDELFSDDELLQTFREKALKDLPDPRIVSEALDVFDNGGERDALLRTTKQFRFMGQRFTPDAYVINNLTQGAGSPDPETGQNLPSMPTALMAMRVIAPENKTVQKYLKDWISDPVRIAEQERESDKIIAKVLGKLDTEFAAYDQRDWTKNMYWSWLNCFKSLLGSYGEGYPYFMQTENWQKKNLGTALGSFTEIKHDTLLYAKQSYAEMGGGGDETEIPPVPKGYVEPDLLFWNRLEALATVTQEGLEERGVFPEEFKPKYNSFLEATKFFKAIAEKELQNQKISDEDFEKLRTIKSSFASITSPLGGSELSQKDKRAGIIADIHTDVSHENQDLNKILYEATGKPYVIYVAVKDINGTRLTRGVVYSHYEFGNKISDGRLSDEDWQKRVYEGEGTMPMANKWSLEIIK